MAIPLPVLNSTNFYGSSKYVAPLDYYVQSTGKYSRICLTQIIKGLNPGLYDINFEYSTRVEIGRPEDYSFFVELSNYNRSSIAFRSRVVPEAFGKKKVNIPLVISQPKE